MISADKTALSDGSIEFFLYSTFHPAFRKMLIILNLSSSINKIWVFALISSFDAYS